MQAEDTNLSPGADDGLVDDLAEYDLVDDAPLGVETLSDLVLYSLDWSVQSLLERIGTTFDINPSFQRRDAWTAERKSLYIESLVLGLPVPQIVLAEDRGRKGRFIVLDGKQRLLTLKQFASPGGDYRPLKLRRLEFASELNGLTFAEMQASLTGMELASSFLSQPVRTVVVRNWSEPAVLYQIFVRLNQGSLTLSPQELRQALFPSAFTRWINDRSAASSLIQRARRIKGADFRMRDAEMLLRYVAFSEWTSEYRGNLRQFLDEACARGDERWQEDGQAYFESLAERCERAIESVFSIFGEENSFLRFESDGYVRRFNIAVFDLLTVLLGDVSVEPGAASENSEAIRRAYETLCVEDPRFQESLRTTTKSIEQTRRRFVVFGERLEEILGVTLTTVEGARQLPTGD